MEVGKEAPGEGGWLARANAVEQAAYRAYLESIFQGVADSLVVADLDGTVRMVNAGTLALLARAKDELIGKPIELLAPQEELFRQRRWGQRLREAPVRNHRTALRAKDATEIPVSLSVSLLPSRTGAPMGMVCIAKDMRELIALQEQERRLQKALLSEQIRVEISGNENQRLDQLVRERTAQLEKTLQDLQRAQRGLIQAEKMTAVGQLAAGVAHEVNNPIGIILGFAQSVARRISASDPLCLPIKSIEREALRCKGLVQNLLSFARHSAPRLEPFDLDEAAEGMLSIVAAQARVRSVEVVKELGGAGAALGDRNQVQQVIVNLCNNALDAVPDGGRIILRTRIDGADGRLIVLEVEDNGAGIPEGVRDKVFDPFFTTKEPGKGTGLGLSLTYEIVQRHNGRIEFQSAVGRGTIFTVFLPAADRVPPEDGRAS